VLLVACVVYSLSLHIHSCSAVMEDHVPQNGLEKMLRDRLDNRYIKSRLRKLTVSPVGAVDFSSNDFLSLSTSPLLRSAFLEELNRYSSTFAIGSGGSRLLDGNSAYADQLEMEIAAFHNAPTGLLWNSGFDANSGMFACIPQPGDVIIHDELIHASVHDGMKLSRAAKCIPFAHNSVSHLRQLVGTLVAKDEEMRHGRKNVFIAVESVYSMDGDLAPLTEIKDLKDELLPKGNCHIIVDEAHATGVLGPNGRGLVSQLGLEKDIFARLHTFSKGLACSGAIVLCSPLVRSYLINYARPLIYATFMPFPSLAAIKASYSLLSSGRTQALATHLRNLTLRFHSLLREMLAKFIDCPAIDKILSIPESCPQSPIFSLVTEHPRSLAKHLQDGGFVVRPVVPPTVPTSRVRVCLHAGNSMKELENLVTRIEEWVNARTMQSQADMGSSSVGSQDVVESVKPRL